MSMRTRMVTLRGSQLSWWIVVLALGCSDPMGGDAQSVPDTSSTAQGEANPASEASAPSESTENGHDGEHLPEEALLDPRYEDELHTGPCPTVEIPAERETIVELLGGSSSQGAERFSQLSIQAGPLNMLIGVRGGADFSRVGDIECPQDGRRSCAEREQAISEADSISRASQRCVHAFVKEVGGQVTATFSLGNALGTLLTWQQLVRVAAHPHVLSLSDGLETTPPP